MRSMNHCHHRHAISSHARVDPQVRASMDFRHEIMRSHYRFPDSHNTVPVILDPGLSLWPIPVIFAGVRHNYVEQYISSRYS